MWRTLLVEIYYMMQTIAAKGKENAVKFNFFFVGKIEKTRQQAQFQGNKIRSLWALTKYRQTKNKTAQKKNSIFISFHLKFGS